MEKVTKYLSNDGKVYDTEKEASEADKILQKGRLRETYIANIKSKLYSIVIEPEMMVNDVFVFDYNDFEKLYLILHNEEFMGEFKSLNEAYNRSKEL